MNDATPILIGNSFPFSLIRREVVVKPRSLDDLREALSNRPWLSFWGHANTAAAASELLGHNIRPATERPALTLDETKLPNLDGTSCRECWILSPDYSPGYRPAPNQEVAADKILGWQVLEISW